jgi:hypothetical protein
MTLSARPEAPFETSGIFAVIAFGAALIVAAVQAIRFIAVRLPWTS